MKHSRISLALILFLLLGLVAQKNAFAETLYIGGVSFDVPSEWPETQPSSPMRAAQYKIPKTGSDPEDGEMAVFFFGEGEGGDIDANLVRWRQQFESPEGDAGQIEKKIINGLPVISVYLTGTYKANTMTGDSSQPKSDYAFNGAIISGSQGQIFIKLLAPRQTMEAAKVAFQKMLTSIQSTLNS